MIRSVFHIVVALLVVALMSLDAFAEDGRLRRDLLLLYDFDESSGTVIHDRSGHEPLFNLQIHSPDAARFDSGALVITAPASIRSSDPAEKIISAVKNRGMLSVEVWITPDTIEQAGPARIVSLSKNPSERNLTLGQDKNRFDVRLRTSGTSTNGVPSLAAPENTVSAELTHVVYTRDRSGRARLYVNGEAVVDGDVTGNTSNWDDGLALALGNELTGDRPWLGSLHLMAVYRRALAPSEVERNFAAGPNAEATPLDDAETNGADGDLAFETQIAPILARNCLECHDTVAKRSGLDLSRKDAAFAGGEGGKVIVAGQSAQSTLWTTMQEKPRDLFDRVFGTIELGADGSDRRLRLKRSVLDTVVDQYKFFTGARSLLGKASRTRVADHLEGIREYERRAYALKDKTPQAPPVPPASDIPHGGPADPAGQGIDIALEDLTTEWRLMADLYALAVQLDRVRFGSVTFLAAGERIRLKGDYEYDGRKVFSFDDGGQRNKSGDQGCSHEWWHEFDEEQQNEALRAHAHLKMREVAYFLTQLDGDDAKEPNGRTILENSLITISTESGDGRHNDVKRELSGVLHAVTGANGRFKTGQFVDLGAEGVDVYNTLLDGLGVSDRLGPAERDAKSVDAIRT